MPVAPGTTVTAVTTVTPATGEVIQFPMSLELEAADGRGDEGPLRRLWLSWGRDDRATMLSQLPLHELKALLRSVRPEDRGAGCVDEPLHANFMATCRSCLADRRGGSCHACVRLGCDYVDINGEVGW